MADHMRQQIRDAVVTAVTGLTTTGSNVFNAREWPQEAGDLPALRVYTPDEESEPDNMTRPRSMERSLELVIEGIARATSGVVGTLDTIAAEVEAALGNNLLSGKVKDMHLARTESPAHDVTGNRPVGLIRLTYAVSYRTPEADPTTGA